MSHLHKPLISELYLLFNEKTLIYLLYVFFDDIYYDGENVMLPDGSIRTIVNKTIFEQRKIINLEQSGKFIICDSFKFKNVQNQILVSPMNQFFKYNFRYITRLDSGGNVYDCIKQTTQIITKIVTEYPQLNIYHN